MASHIAQYYRLSVKDQEIVRHAARSGDNFTTREVLKQYFPRLSASQITTLLTQLRGMV
jgi:hypothetical protein